MGGWAGGCGLGWVGLVGMSDWRGWMDTRWIGSVGCVCVEGVICGYEWRGRIHPHPAPITNEPTDRRVYLHSLSHTQHQNKGATPPSGSV